MIDVGRDLQEAYDDGYAQGRQDARPTGEWQQISPARIYQCSNCGQNVMTNDIDVYKFCHGCGADMRGGEDE